MAVARSKVLPLSSRVALLDPYGVVFPADDVLDVRLEGTLGARAQFTEVRQDGVPPLFRP